MLDGNDFLGEEFQEENMLLLGPGKITILNQVVKKGFNVKEAFHHDRKTLFGVWVFTRLLCLK